MSTYHFIKSSDLEDTFNIAEILVLNEHELINKVVRSWIKVAGKKNEKKLKSFLDKYATTMLRITLRYAIEKLDRETKADYINQKQNKLCSKSD